jgi:thiamine biosynthesis lipoprotein ApbE
VRSDIVRLRLVLSGLLLAAFVASVAVAEPVRLAGRAFDRRAEIEVRDLPVADAERAIQEAFRELERAREELRAIEAAANPATPVQLDARQSELLRRALGTCYWSEGAVGPLGGEVFRLWGLRFPATSFPIPDELERAVDAARCERATLDVPARVLRVAAAGALDFFPFELGWAVDRAAESLRAAGAADFWIELGGVARAAGPGPTGRGWSYELPPLPGQLEALPPFLLRDRAMALLRPGDRPLRIAGESFPPYLNQRRGRPGGAAIAAVVVVSELAVDAQAVGYAMFALGPHDGTMLLGALPERPSIRWFLGTGDGPPVLTDVNWGVVGRP